MDREEGHFEPMNPDQARRGGPFSSFGLPAQPGQAGQGGLGSGSNSGRPAPDEAYRPPEMGRDAVDLHLQIDLEQRAGLLDKREEQYDISNSDTARRGGP